MNTITAIKPECFSSFSFNPLIKIDTYSFLYFVPQKNNPDKQSFKIQLLDKDNEIIEEKIIQLELTQNKNNFEEHSIGMICDGEQHKIIFTPIMLDEDSGKLNLPITVAVVKIKDGDDGGIKEKPFRLKPRKPVLMEY